MNSREAAYMGAHYPELRRANEHTIRYILLLSIFLYDLSYFEHSGDRLPIFKSFVTVIVFLANRGGSASNFGEFQTASTVKSRYVRSI